MTLSIQPSLPPAARPGQPLPLAGPLPGAMPIQAGIATDASDGRASVQFSPIGVLLAQLLEHDGADAPRPLPAGSPQAQQLASWLAQRLGVLFREAGLDARAPVSFEVDDAGRVRVTSPHPDVAGMQAVVDTHADVQALVRTLHAVDLSRSGEAAALLVAAGSRDAGVAGTRGSPPAIDAAAHRATPPWNDWAAALLGRETRGGGRSGRLAWLLVASLLAIVLVWLL